MKKLETGTSFAGWHKQTRYRALRYCDRADWAWEFVRRNPKFPKLVTTSATRHLLRKIPPVTLVTLEEDMHLLRPWGVRFRSRTLLLSTMPVLGVLARGLPRKYSSRRSKAHQLC